MPSPGFEKAAERAKTLKDVNQDNLLKLYGLFKQANFGDNKTEKPGLFDPKGKFKWEAWTAEKDKSQVDAENEYIALVDSLMGDKQTDAPVPIVST